MSSISDEEWQNMSPEERLEFQVKNCVFCKIIKGEIPSNKIFEDSDFVGVFDINPGAKGHVLLLSKNHVQIMPQLGTELSGKLGVVIKSLVAKIKKVLGVSSVSVFVANGAVAGQNAPHFMVHIIPRKDNDNINLNPSLVSINESNVVTLRNNFLSVLGLPNPSDASGVSKANSKDKEEDKNNFARKKEEQVNVKSVNVNDVIDKNNGEGKDVVDKELLDKISKMFD
jgi:histidine triad (HIT) family protein